jgi:hypothetical protein
MSDLNFNSSQDMCAATRVDLNNQRIYDRNIPSQILQPYISVRPVMTKYSFMPIVDPRAPVNVPMEQLPIYNQEKLFNPGTAAPWSGYASNVNVESDLRNQIFALQKCSQAVYVPSSNSDLYQFEFKSTKQDVQPFPNLFANEKFSEFNPNPENIAHGVFYNATRQQLKNAGDIMYESKNGGCITETTTTKTKTENKKDVKNKK